MLRRWFYE